MVPLVLIVPDFAHLRSIRSPLLRYFPKELENPALAACLRACLPVEPSSVNDADADGRISWSEAYGALCQSDKQTGAFRDFTPAELEIFMERSQLLRCTLGQQIIAEGQGTRTAYVVLEGSVEVRTHGSKLATIGQGEMFGEFAFLWIPGGRRTSSPPVRTCACWFWMNEPWSGCSRPTRPSPPNSF